MTTQNAVTISFVAFIFWRWNHKKPQIYSAIDSKAGPAELQFGPVLYWDVGMISKRRRIGICGTIAKRSHMDWKNLPICTYIFPGDSPRCCSCQLYDRTKMQFIPLHSKAVASCTAMCTHREQVHIAFMLIDFITYIQGGESPRKTGLRSK